MNLIEQIQHEMTNDDADPEQGSGRIIDTYENADIEARRALDDVFISLCGYSLHTMIQRGKNG